MAVCGRQCDWVKRYPIASLEDGMGEEDRAGWLAITKALGGKLQLVGDDNFVTNPKIFAEGIKAGIAIARPDSGRLVSRRDCL